MQDNDFQVFTVLMTTIGELYGKIISKPLTEIYWRTLKNFEWQDVQQALEAHIHHPDSGQFFPKPSDVVRFIEGSSESKALKAWSKVETAIHRVGRYESIAFDDSLIHAVLEDMDGWVKLCAITFDELPVRAHEFQKRYMEHVLKKPIRYPSYLYGVVELENAKNGYHFKPPLLVGEASKVKQVMLNGGGISLAVQSLHSIEDFSN